MRTQTVRKNTGRISRLMIITAGCVLFLAVLFVGYRIFIYREPFVPPAFEAEAQQGVPAPEDSLQYGSVSAPTGFSIGLCGTMYQQQDGSLVLYLTNPEANSTNIRCEIKNEAGELLYECGVLRPGEYMERLLPVTEIPNEAMKIRLFVYGYEPDSWYSCGTIELENTLQPY